MTSIEHLESVVENLRERIALLEKVVPVKFNRKKKLSADAKHESKMIHKNNIRRMILTKKAK
jgi:hypothetical protein